MIQAVHLSLIAKSEACQRFEVPPDRVGDVVVIFNPAQGAWHDAEASRPVRSHRTAALSWRTNRADSADDRQPHCASIATGRRATLCALWPCACQDGSPTRIICAMPRARSVLLICAFSTACMCRVDWKPKMAGGKWPRPLAQCGRGLRGLCGSELCSAPRLQPATALRRST
jgi:hypothetical protein